MKGQRPYSKKGATYSPKRHTRTMSLDLIVFPTAVNYLRRTVLQPCHIKTRQTVKINPILQLFTLKTIDRDTTYRQAGTQQGTQNKTLSLFAR